jgi:hypothetical protein
MPEGTGEVQSAFRLADCDSPRNATLAIGRDQFMVARLGRDCRRLWLSRHTASRARRRRSSIF